MILKKQAKKMHHISSHFTNGLFPTAAICITIFLLTGNKLFGNTALCCIAIGAIAAPVVYGCGLTDWWVRFEKRRAKIFDRKRYVGAVLVLFSIILISTRLYIGDDILTVGIGKYFYAGGIYIITSIVSYLGYLGGKFII
ncbi:MAG: hypothetical protein GY793_12205 [Proteobacteria bacterium]|nr:hypothetical protein [Pseudomonadota bacterium]